MQSRKIALKLPIAKLGAKAKAIASTYFGMGDFAFAPAYALA